VNISHGIFQIPLDPLFPVKRDRKRMRRSAWRKKTVTRPTPPAVRPEHSNGEAGAPGEGGWCAPRAAASCTSTPPGPGPRRSPPPTPDSARSPPPDRPPDPDDQDPEHRQTTLSRRPRTPTNQTSSRPIDKNDRRSQYDRYERSRLILIFTRVVADQSVRSRPGGFTL
jgi:hypothetical protein